MKKILAALLVLALAIPAMADVAITASDAGSQQLQISFAGPTDAVRGIALTVTVTNGTIESGAFISSDFNTFIDYAFTTGAGYTIGSGHPFALETTAGVAAFPIASGPFAVSVGYLDESGAKKGLTSGSVALIQISNIPNNESATVTIAANATRGGAAVGDTLGTVTVQPQVLVAGPVVPVNCNVSKPTIVKTTAAPAVAGLVNGSRAETFVASATSDQGHALQYQFTWGDGNVSDWGSDTQGHTYSYAAAATYNVTVQARCTVDGALSVASDALVEATEPVKSSATFYAVWADFSRPNCWAFKRNCRGDANGGKVGVLWVQTIDLNVLMAGWGKQDAALKLASYDPDGAGIIAPIPAICADFNRAKVGVLRVQTNDLNILMSYWGKIEAQVPVCDQTNYHYWTN